MTTAKRYSASLIALHWVLAVSLVGLFGLGLWMVELGYYDPWYRKAPDLHKSIGVCVVALMLLRAGIRLAQGVPAAISNHSVVEKKLAGVAQFCLYALVFLMFPSGYLISTADGRALDVFGVVSIPALITSVDNLEDIAGEVHEILAFSLIAIASMHALAAFKHHWIDRDDTLRRMLGLASRQRN